MFESIWEDIKQQFRIGNMVTRLVILNVAVFVLVSLVHLGLVIYYGFNKELSDPAFNTFTYYLSLSSDPIFNLTHPWVIFTHMFLHKGFFHILFNVLFLYWFGRIVGSFIGDRKILPLYLVGGLVGAFVYMISYNFLPYSDATVGTAMGASAAVMAIVVAAGAIAPEYMMRLLFLGDIKLKYIAAAFVFLDLVGIGNMENTGGHFAHLGGALFGWFFIKQLKTGNDLSIPVNNILDKIFDFFKQLFGGKSTRRPKVVYKNPNIKQKKGFQGSGRSNKPKSGELSHQEKVDSILDKIKQSGYDSLSEEEKEFLFNASKE